MAETRAGIFRVLCRDSFFVSFYGWHPADKFIAAWREAGFRLAGHLTFTKRYSSTERFLQYRHENAYLLAKGNRKLRERLQARDDNLLEAMRKGETLAYGPWADFFLENYSKPPVRAEKAHEANERCIKHLKAAFGTRRLVEITADSIELYLS